MGFVEAKIGLLLMKLRNIQSRYGKRDVGAEEPLHDTK